MILSNYHVHSVFCDGKNTVEEMAEAAFEAGITSLGFSGHAPLLYDNDWTMKAADVEAYLAEVHRIKGLYEGKMAIYTGMEIDYDMDLKDISPLVKALRSRLDYVIGSIHVMGVLPNGVCSDIDYTPENFKAGIKHCFGGSVRRLVETYYRSVADMAEKIRPEIVGHLDLIKKNNPDGCWYDEAAPWARQAALEALEAIRDAGCIIEVNTGGMARYGSRCLYPSDWLLEKILDLKIPIVLNGDAHTREAITYAYESVLKKLLEMGFKTLMYYDGSDWVEQALVVG